MQLTRAEILQEIRALEDRLTISRHNAHEFYEETKARLQTLIGVVQTLGDVVAPEPEVVAPEPEVVAPEQS